jgi:hypothetical protein
MIHSYIMISSVIPGMFIIEASMWTFRIHLWEIYLVSINGTSFALIQFSWLQDYSLHNFNVLCLFQTGLLAINITAINEAAAVCIIYWWVPNIQATTSTHGYIKIMISFTDDAETIHTMNLKLSVTRAQSPPAGLMQDLINHRFDE